MGDISIAESEWVPVPPKEKKEEDKVFTKPEVPVSTRKPKALYVLNTLDINNFKLCSL